MSHLIATFLMFEGNAEEAMNLYLSLFDKSSVLKIERYGTAGPGADGSVKRADFVLAGHRLICIDSPAHHDFTFTPAISIYVDCESEADLEHKFTALSTDGAVLMPLGDYGFSRRFGWLKDRFGVSWQLNLP